MGPSSGRSHFHNRMQQILESKARDGDEIIEAGCAGGLISLELAQNFNLKRLVLFDIDKQLLLKAKKNFEGKKLKTSMKNIYFKQGDLQNMPYADNSFDLVFNQAVVAYLPDMKKGVEEMIRVSRRDTVIFSPNFSNPLWSLFRQYGRISGSFIWDCYGKEKHITGGMLKKFISGTNTPCDVLGMGTRKLDMLFPGPLKSCVCLIATKRD